MIYINKWNTSTTNKLLFGLAYIVDGLIRVISLGNLHTSFPLKASMYIESQRLEAVQKARGLM